jgi:hypothetical protein
MRLRFPVRSQRIGTGLILAGAYMWMGLNVWFRPVVPPPEPTWFPMPPDSEQGRPRERDRFPRSNYRDFPSNRRPLGTRDTNVVWVQRPKLRYPVDPIDANALDSLDVLEWGVSPFSVAAFFRARRTWRGFVSPDQLPNSASIWPIAWTFGPLPPPRVLHTLSKEELGRHPLIGWERAAAYHRYRSRVRPVRSWGELRALSGWGEVDETLLRRYFVLSRKDSLSLHP